MYFENDKFSFFYCPSYISVEVISFCKDKKLNTADEWYQKGNTKRYYEKVTYFFMTLKTK